MRKDTTPKRRDVSPSVWLRQCPNCEPARIMNIKTIRTTMFRGYAFIIYECRQCRTEATDSRK